MRRYVGHGATLRCSAGNTPASLQTPLPGGARSGGRRLATVNDHQPHGCVPPFGLCRSLTNPQVAAATTAAQGALTPQPCSPVITAPWSPGSRIFRADGVALLTDDSTCACAWGGVIDVVSSDQSLAVELAP